MSGRAGLVARGEGLAADGADGGGIKSGLGIILSQTNKAFLIMMLSNFNEGFSEFVELIAKIALIGMDNPNYNVLFPTPFSKVPVFYMYFTK